MLPLTPRNSFRLNGFSFLWANCDVSIRSSIELLSRLVTLTGLGSVPDFRPNKKRGRPGLPRLG